MKLHRLIFSFALPLSLLVALPALTGCGARSGGGGGGGGSSSCSSNDDCRRSEFCEISQGLTTKGQALCDADQTEVCEDDFGDSCEPFDENDPFCTCECIGGGGNNGGNNGGGNEACGPACDNLISCGLAGPGDRDGCIAECSGAFDAGITNCIASASCDGIEACIDGGGNNGGNNGAANNGAANNGGNNGGGSPRGRCVSIDDNNGTINNGDPNNGDPNNGDPNNGTVNNGDPNNGTTNNGNPNNGNPNNGQMTCDDDILTASGVFRGEQDFAVCDDPSVPKNCRSTYWIVTSAGCYCTWPCGDIGVNVGEACDTNGVVTCQQTVQDGNWCLAPEMNVCVAE